MRRLNLGCGIYYNPKFINMDFKTSSVSDIITNIQNLPIQSNIIEEIEASHILEHFDTCMLPFVLSEWFRILEPNGIIHIETPDLKGCVGNLRFKSYSSQKNTLRFLFGLNDLGNTHKLGFTVSFLKKTLKSIGFENISKERPLSFKKEAGLRISATKPEINKVKERKQFLIEFRTGILREFHNKDSYFFDSI